MTVLLSGFSALSSIIQLILFLILFVALLFGAHFFTKWYAKSGIVHSKTSNIEILESQQITPGKNIIIAKIGTKYVSFVLLKENAEFLTELTKDDLVFAEDKVTEPVSFKDMLGKVSQKIKRGNTNMDKSGFPDKREKESDDV